MREPECYSLKEEQCKQRLNMMLWPIDSKALCARITTSQHSQKSCILWEQLVYLKSRKKFGVTDSISEKREAIKKMVVWLDLQGKVIPQPCVNTCFLSFLHAVFGISREHSSISVRLHHNDMQIAMVFHDFFEEQETFQFRHLLSEVRKGDHYMVSHRLYLNQAVSLSQHCISGQMFGLSV